MRGRFISLEGGEGVGKSTQARLLVAALAQHGVDALLTREPGGSEGAEAIRGLLLSGPAERWTIEAEALLFAAARADHVARTIRPALAAGRWVVCDRFLDSSRAYQGTGDALEDDAIMALHRIGSGGLLPDRTLLLALPLAESSARAGLRDGDEPDRIGGRDAAFHHAVGAAFTRFAAADPARFRQVDASGPAATVSARLLAALGDLLP
ncbi:MAG TPA: dTMP kinase [Sphingobium sp.]|nr:dTMP kinase [Sphingobium sp.]